MSTGNLHRILYCSDALPASATTPALSLPEILRISQPRNEAAGVTGALLSCDGRFLQVLEGPMTKVLETYGRIFRDPRHTELKVIEAARVGSRLFPNWGMCGAQLAPVDTEIVRVMASRGRFNPASLSPAKALALLAAVRNMQTKQRGDTEFLV